MARFFLAIWPDAGAGAALERLAHDVALVAEGRAVERASIHLTLAFLGEVEKAREAAIHGVAHASTSVRPFRLLLDRVGSFRRARVAWAGPSQVPEELTLLQSGLEQGLRDGGIKLEDRPYRAHVTLARKVAKPLPMAAIQPVELICQAFALVVSAGGRYTTVASWPLG